MASIRSRIGENMEDRYLFKAKRIDNGEWLVGYVVKYGYTGKEKYYIVPSYASDLYAIEIDPSTICQCTGLKDKNCKLIWENDIIECKNGKHNFQTQIEWDAYCAGFIFQDTETSAVGLDAIAANGLYSESKVIGNIFDNKELLESEEN
jgi:uncharacterized phage protein (TIGR01671 family)